MLAIIFYWNIFYYKEIVYKNSSFPPIRIGELEGEFFSKWEDWCKTDMGLFVEENSILDQWVIFQGPERKYSTTRFAAEILSIKFLGGTSTSKT